MMEYKFNSSTVYICEDTARALVYQPTKANNQEIINFIDKNNYICVGVHTENIELQNTFSYYFNCEVNADVKVIKNIEASFT